MFTIIGLILDIVCFLILGILLLPIFLVIAAICNLWDLIMR